jgi:EmrB/QacA subfamily drug resistance transporter
MAPAAGPRSFALAVAVLTATQLLFVFDGMVVNLALPAIQRDLGLSRGALQWVIIAYTLPLGGLLLLGGRLGDLVGRRRTLMCGLLMFAAGSLGAGLAPSPATMLAARALQGVGGALSTPAALSLISATFPPGELRRRAFVVATVVGNASMIAGAVLGGLITTLLGWPWVFFVGVPIAVAAALAAPHAVPESRDDDAPRTLDVAGAATGTLGLALLVFAVTRVNGEGAAIADALVPGVAALALLAAFVAVEARVSAPLLRLALLRGRTLSAAAFGIFANSGAFTAAVFLASLYLQRELGHSAVRAGVDFVPMAIAGVIAGSLAARLMHDGRWPRLAVAGLACSIAGFLALAATSAHSGYAGVLPALLLVGVGVSLAYVPLTASAGDDVRPGEKGLAYGVFESATHIGGTITLAIVATIAAAPASLATGLDAGLLVAAAVAGVGALAVLAVAARGEPRPA